MKKSILVLFYILFLNFTSRADFGIWGSAVYLSVNGNNEFYNTQQLNLPFAIGRNQFSGSLGVFGYKSGNLKIAGAEINTTKSNLFSVCEGAMFYTIYEEGNRPASPAFSSINLGLYCKCNGAIYNGCGSGACNGINDQKFQNVSRSVDLTGFTMGNYTIELYYVIYGQVPGGPCNQERVDDASGQNYKASFSIVSPLALNLVSLNGSTGDKDVKIKWSILNDVDVIKYVVEKSENGLSFHPLGSINSNQTTILSNYLYTDANPVFGTNYYRIRVYYSNGVINLSNVFRIYFGKVVNSLFIYPNPSATELTVRFVDVSKGKYQLSVLSNTGQQILTMPFYHDGNDKTFTINMPTTLARGIYQLFLIDKIQFYKQSFIVR